LQRDRNGIQVYTRAVEGSPYNEVRAVTVMENLRLSALVALIEDDPACADWADGKVEIQNQAHINPGSPLPGWITNMLLVDTLFLTMEAFVQEVMKPEYRDAQISFITEPH